MLAQAAMAPSAITEPTVTPAWQSHVAHLALIAAQEALTTVRGVDGAFAPGLTNEVEHAAELPTGDLHLRVVGCPPHGEDGVDAPVGDAFADEVVADRRQLVVVALVDAGDHVGGDSRILGE